MILVDIQVPALGQVYDFELDETSKVKELAEDIPELVSCEERLFCENGKDMCLYSMGTGKILEQDKSLEEQGVSAGDRLILF